MAKDFTRSLGSNNPYKPKFGSGKPVKVDIKDVDDLVNTDIDSVKDVLTKQVLLPSESSRNHEKIKEENGELRASLSRYKKENINLKARVEALEKKIMNLTNSSNKKLVALNSDLNFLFEGLTSNASKMLKSLIKVGINKDEYVELSRTTLIEEYNIHRSHFNKSRDELEDRGIIKWELRSKDNSKVEVYNWKLT